MYKNDTTTFCLAALVTKATKYNHMEQQASPTHETTYINSFPVTCCLSQAPFNSSEEIINNLPYLPYSIEASVLNIK